MSRLSPARNYTPLCDRWILKIGFTPLICYGLITGKPALAQIAPDATLPPGEQTQVATPRPLFFQVEGGAIRGSNLFHSFSQFSLPTGGTVFFANSPAIANILARVTGPAASHIDGLIQTSGQASLFLINPNGISFGPNARLAINGSFLAGTASAFDWGNGQQFSATNPQAPPLLAVNLQPGLQYGPGGVVGGITSTATLAVPGDLTLAGGTVQLRGSLQAGGQLNLQALEQLQIRDSTLQPFVAQAGQALQLQAGLVDIFALSHPASGLFAGGDIVLRSPQAISGDTQYTSGGNIRFELPDGRDGSLASLYDPVLRASGDVTMASYNGPSLHILAGGRVTISGNVTITGPDNTGFINALVPLSDGSTIAVNGSARPTLDIRAGTQDFNPPGLTGNGAGFNGLATPATGSSADITIGGIVTMNGANGLVLLTNQYQPNNLTSPQGIRIGRVRSVTTGSGATVILDSRSTITTTDQVSASAGGGGRGGNGGDVKFLANGNITLQTNSALLALNALPGIVTNGLLTGTVTLLSRNGTVAIDSGAIQGSSLSTVAGSQGGSINVTAQSLVMTNSANYQGGLSNPLLTLGLQSRTFGAARAGNINVNVSGAIDLTNGPEIDTVVFTGASGRGGDINVRGGSLKLDKAAIIAITLASGGTGNINLAIGGTVQLQNLSQIAAIVNAGATGAGGNVTLDVGRLNLAGGSQVNAFTSGQANAGQVTATAQEGIFLDGVSSSGVLTGILNYVFNPRNAQGQVTSVARGNGGQITLTAPLLVLTNGAQIGASTEGLGNAGLIAINAPQIQLSGSGTSGQRVSPTAITSEVLAGASGQGGDIRIQTADLSVTNGALITTSTAGQGPAGSIFIDASRSITLDGAGSVLRVDTLATAQGDGGSLTVTTPNLTLTNGARFLARTLGRGAAGDMQLNVRDRISLSGRGTGLFASATATSSGPGGSIFIDPQLLSLQQGARISVSNLGSGVGGDIQIQAGQLILDGQSAILAETASNQGGDIQLVLQDLLLLRRNSLISATAGTAQAGGNGGNINISVPFVVTAAFENNDIRANAFTGRGGNIQISAQSLFGIQFQPQDTPLSDITASSQFGAPGVVVINTPDVDPSRGLVGLPADLVDASNLVAQGCAATNTAKTQGEFIVTGRGGLPPSPTDTLNRDAILTDWAGEAIAPLPTTTHAPSPPPASDAIVEAQGWMHDSRGNILLTAQVGTVPHANWAAPVPCPAPARN